MSASFSVITPALNGGRFIERAVESVLGQGMEVDYVVVDGGSTDDTLSKLQRFGERLRVVPAPGGGQSLAINRGVAETRGGFIAILNADDWYLPGAFAAAAAAFRENPEAAAVYGHAELADDEDRIIGRYPSVHFSREELQQRCIVCQPAAFIRREAYETLGGFNVFADFVLDYEFWIRLSERFPLAMFDETVAVSRVHEGNKSFSNRKRVLHEAIDAVRRSYGYVPYSWIFAYSSLLVNGDDRHPRRRALLSVPLSLAFGCALNARRMRDYIVDWANHRAFTQRA